MGHGQVDPGWIPPAGRSDSSSIDPSNDRESRAPEGARGDARRGVRERGLNNVSETRNFRTFMDKKSLLLVQETYDNK